MFAAVAVSGTNAAVIRAAEAVPPAAPLRARAQQKRHAHDARRDHVCFAQVEGVASAETFASVLRPVRRPPGRATVTSAGE